MCNHTHLAKKESEKFYHCMDCGKPFRAVELNVQDPDIMSYMKENIF